MAKAKGGHRFSLVVYTRMLNRWYPALLLLGVGLLALSLAVYLQQVEQWRWIAFASIGGLNIFAGILLFLLRKGAYVQPFRDHLKLATPFLRLNISYRRILRASPVTMNAVFPPKSVSDWQAEIIRPLARMTAIVIELNALPMSQSALRLFLSPLFFKDKSPHFVLLVDDWMRFSAELESMRAGTDSAPQSRQPKSSILNRLPRK